MERKEFLDTIKNFKDNLKNNVYAGDPEQFNSDVGAIQDMLLQGFKFTPNYVLKASTALAKSNATKNKETNDTSKQKLIEELEHLESLIEQKQANGMVTALHAIAGRCIVAKANPAEYVAAAEATEERSALLAEAPEQTQAAEPVINAADLLADNSKLMKEITEMRRYYGQTPSWLHHIKNPKYLLDDQINIPIFLKEIESAMKNSDENEYGRLKEIRTELLAYQEENKTELERRAALTAQPGEVNPSIATETTGDPEVAYFVNRLTDTLEEIRPSYKDALSLQSLNIETLKSDESIIAGALKIIDEQFPKANSTQQSKLLQILDEFYQYQAKNTAELQRRAALETVVESPEANPLFTKPAAAAENREVAEYLKPDSNFRQFIAKIEQWQKEKISQATERDCRDMLEQLDSFYQTAMGLSEEKGISIPQQRQIVKIQDQIDKLRVQINAEIPKAVARSAAAKKSEPVSPENDLDALLAAIDAAPMPSQVTYKAAQFEHLGLPALDELVQDLEERIRKQDGILNSENAATTLTDRDRQDAQFIKDDAKAKLQAVNQAIQNKLALLQIPPAPSAAARTSAESGAPRASLELPETITVQPASAADAVPLATVVAKDTKKEDKKPGVFDRARGFLGLGGEKKEKMPAAETREARAESSEKDTAVKSKKYTSVDAIQSAFTKAAEQYDKKKIDKQAYLKTLGSLLQAVRDDSIPDKKERRTWIQTSLIAEMERLEEKRPELVTKVNPEKVEAFNRINREFTELVTRIQEGVLNRAPKISYEEQTQSLNSMIIRLQQLPYDALDAQTQDNYKWLKDELSRRLSGLETIKTLAAATPRTPSPSPTEPATRSSRSSSGSSSSAPASVGSRESSGSESARSVSSESKQLSAQQLAGKRVDALGALLLEVSQKLNDMQGKVVGAVMEEQSDTEISALTAETNNLAAYHLQIVSVIREKGGKIDESNVIIKEAMEIAKQLSTAAVPLTVTPLPSQPQPDARAESVELPPAPSRSPFAAVQSLFSRGAKVEKAKKPDTLKTLRDEYYNLYDTFHRRMRLYESGSSLANITAIAETKADYIRDLEALKARLNSVADENDQKQVVLGSIDLEIRNNSPAVQAQQLTAAQPRVPSAVAASPVTPSASTDTSAMLAAVPNAKKSTLGKERQKLKTLQNDILQLQEDIRTNINPAQQGSFATAGNNIKTRLDAIDKSVLDQSTLEWLARLYGDITRINTSLAQPAVVTPAVAVRPESKEEAASRRRDSFDKAFVTVKGDYDREIAKEVRLIPDARGLAEYKQSLEGIKRRLEALKESDLTSQQQPLYRLMLQSVEAQLERISPQEKYFADQAAKKAATGKGFNILSAIGLGSKPKATPTAPSVTSSGNEGQAPPLPKSVEPAGRPSENASVSASRQYGDALQAFIRARETYNAIQETDPNKLTAAQLYQRQLKELASAANLIDHTKLHEPEQYELEVVFKKKKIPEELAKVETLITRLQAPAAAPVQEASSTPEVRTSADSSASGSNLSAGHPYGKPLPVPPRKTPPASRQGSTTGDATPPTSTPAEDQRATRVIIPIDYKAEISKITDQFKPIAGFLQRHINREKTRQVSELNNIKKALEGLQTELRALDSGNITDEDKKDYDALDKSIATHLVAAEQAIKALSAPQAAVSSTSAVAPKSSASPTIETPSQRLEEIFNQFKDASALFQKQKAASNLNGLKFAEDRIEKCKQAFEDLKKSSLPDSEHTLYDLLKEKIEKSEQDVKTAINGLSQPRAVASVVSTAMRSSDAAQAPSQPSPQLKNVRMQNDVINLLMEVKQALKDHESGKMPLKKDDLRKLDEQIEQAEQIRKQINPEHLPIKSKDTYQQLEQHIERGRSEVAKHRQALQTAATSIPPTAVKPSAAATASTVRTAPSTEGAKPKPAANAYDPVKLRWAEERYNEIKNGAQDGNLHSLNIQKRELEQLAKDIHDLKINITKLDTSQTRDYRVLQQNMSTALDRVSKQIAAILPPPPPSPS